MDEELVLNRAGYCLNLQLPLMDATFNSFKSARKLTDLASKMSFNACG
jgi:hypothetical protein